MQLGHSMSIQQVLFCVLYEQSPLKVRKSSIFPIKSQCGHFRFVCFWLNIQTKVPSFKYHKSRSFYASYVSENITKVVLEFLCVQGCRIWHLSRKLFKMHTFSYTEVQFLIEHNVINHVHDMDDNFKFHRPVFPSKQLTPTTAGPSLLYFRPNKEIQASSAAGPC